MAAIPDWLARRATGRAVALAVAVWLGVGFPIFYFSPYEAVGQALGGPPLEESFGFTPAQAQAALGRLDEGVLRKYLEFQVWDIFPVSLMTMAMTLALAWSLGRLTAAGSRARWLVWLPALMWTCDLLLENVLLGILISSPPAREGTTASVAGMATLVKLVVAMAALMVTVVALLAAGMRGLLARRRAQ